MDEPEDKLEDLLSLDGILPVDVLYDKLKIHVQQLMHENAELKERNRSLNQEVGALREKMEGHDKKDERLKELIANLYDTIYASGEDFSLRVQTPHFVPPVPPLMLNSTEDSLPTPSMSPPPLPPAHQSELVAPLIDIRSSSEVSLEATSRDTVRSMKRIVLDELKNTDINTIMTRRGSIIPGKNAFQAANRPEPAPPSTLPPQSSATTSSSLTMSAETTGTHKKTPPPPPPRDSGLRGTTLSADAVQLPLNVIAVATLRNTQELPVKRVSHDALHSLSGDSPGATTIPLITDKGSFKAEQENIAGNFFSESNWKHVVNNECWYRDHFRGRDHMNVIAPDTPAGPLIISILKETNVYGHSSEEASHFYRVIIWSYDGERKVTVPTGEVDPKSLVSSIMAHINPRLAGIKYKACKHSGLTAALLKFEESTTTHHFKFGLLYCKKGQTTEEEMFANSHNDASSDFLDFLHFLGTTVELQGFSQFSGGLDTKNGQTGEHSIFSVWHDNQIMFHVSTLLPHNPSDVQQIEKKRHIGNDIVLIVFQDHDVSQPFCPLTVASHFTELIVVVRPEKNKNVTIPRYRVAVSTKKDVPPFGPLVPSPPVLTAGALGRDFFFAKLINGELSAYQGPSFAEKFRQPRIVMIQEMLLQFSKRASIMVTPSEMSSTLRDGTTVRKNPLTNPALKGITTSPSAPSVAVSAATPTSGSPTTGTMSVAEQNKNKRRSRTLTSMTNFTSSLLTSKKKSS